MALSAASAGVGKYRKFVEPHTLGISYSRAQNRGFWARNSGRPNFRFSQIQSGLDAVASSQQGSLAVRAGANSNAVTRRLAAGGTPHANARWLWARPCSDAAHATSTTVSTVNRWMPSRGMLNRGMPIGGCRWHRRSRRARPASNPLSLLDEAVDVGKLGLHHMHEFRPFSGRVVQPRKYLLPHLGYYPQKIPQTTPVD